MLLSLSFSIGADRYDVSRELGFKIWWRYIAADKQSADMNSDSKVYLVVILSVLLMNDYMGSNQFREVVHDQAGDNFVEDMWISVPSTASSLSPLKVLGDWRDSTDKTREWNRSSNTPAFSLLRCWKKADTDGVSDAFGKADISSLFIDLPSMRSMVSIRVLKGSFLERVKSVSAHFACCVKRNTETDSNFTPGGGGYKWWRV